MRPDLSWDANHYEPGPASTPTVPQRAVPASLHPPVRQRVADPPRPRLRRPALGVGLRRLHVPARAAPAHQPDRASARRPFDIGDATCHRVIATYTPHSARLLPTDPHLDRRHLYVADGSLVPPHDRSETALCKNYRRSVNVRVVARRSDLRIVAVSDPFPGNRIDVWVWKQSGPPERMTGARLMGDGGYRGAHRVSSPRRVPSGASCETRRFTGSAGSGPPPNTCWPGSRIG